MSTSTGVESRFRAALRTRQAKQVAMNQFNGIVFSSTPCIGTDQLGSCSVVLIVSPKAAILGHVAPRPDDTTYPHAGDMHVELFMDKLLNYQYQYEPYFPPNPNAWVVCAMFMGQVALPEQQNIIAKKLREKGFNVDSSHTYPVPYRPTSPNTGSVFVDTRGSKILVYVEDRIAYEMEKNAPADSRWDGKYHVSTKSPTFIWKDGAWVARSTVENNAPQAQPANSQWDGKFYVSTTNPGYVWQNGGWVQRSTVLPAAESSVWQWSASARRYYKIVEGQYVWSDPGSSS